MHPENTTRPSVVVRYGSMGLTGRFVNNLESWRCGQRVVIKSDRGMEIGDIVCSWGGCGVPGGVPPQVKGEVIRNVTHADEIEQRHLAESGQREFTYCKACIASRGLPMKLVGVEHLLGGDRIIFYFVAESRVDFRALVRDLAHEFQTRIEMRQIGVRDEARLLGDYERCGRPLCCRAWIRELEPVSMKMAKIQKATLDPAKISGRCGRLMCCLRFEHTTYRDLARNLPRKNAIVQTPEGLGKVLDSDIVSQTVACVIAGGTRIVVPVENIRPYDPARPTETTTQAAGAKPAVEGEGSAAVAADAATAAATAATVAGDAKLQESFEAPPSHQGRSRDQGRPRGEQGRSSRDQGKPRESSGRPRDQGKPREQRKPSERTKLRDQVVGPNGRPVKPEEAAAAAGAEPGTSAAPVAGPPDAVAAEPAREAAPRSSRGASARAPEGAEAASREGAAAGAPGEAGAGTAAEGERRGRRGRRRSRRGGRNRSRGSRGPGGEGGAPGQGGSSGEASGRRPEGGRRSEGGSSSVPGSSGPAAGPPATSQGS
jgi:cell fate regulator YaaT (PSP1 superfamily)